MPDKSDGPTQGLLETGSLLEAILAVQAEVGPIAKDAINPHFRSKYTTLGTIVETVGPILNKHGLVWMTFPESAEGGRPVLGYRLQHAQSGEKVGGVMPLLLTKQDPQGLGSALTYARRYSLCAVLNLVADDDDDGNTASQKQSAGDLARAKSRMGDEEKALLAEAQQLYATWTGEGKITEAQFKAYQDSTGYTAEGLQRLVNWLKERA
jgi:hypothetical protein